MKQPIDINPDKKAFFDAMDAQYTSLTFDDVRLVTGPGDIDAVDVDLTTQFSRNISLKTPFVSAAMDTVTEAPMAIAIAKAGGIGVIHAGLDIQQQHDEVRRVKLALNGLIERPITVRAEQSVGSVLEYCDEKEFDFRSFPVVDSGGGLVGLMSGADFTFCREMAAPVSLSMKSAEDVITGNAGMSIREAYEYMWERRLKQLPLIDDLGRVAGMYVYSDVKRIVEEHSGPYNVDDNGRLRTAAAVPTNPEALQRVEAMRKYLDVVVLDSAHGDSKHAPPTLRDLKAAFPELDVVIGNVSSGKSAKMLAEAGADAVKVGQGGGSICTTRIETGIGTPQLSAVYNCARAIRESNHPDVPIISDGGIRNAGDISFAIGAGADSVMLGSVLAGTDETPGVIEIRGVKQVKLYRGMGSPSALRESAASRARYGSGAAMPLPEGVESVVEYKGPVETVLYNHATRLRKSLAYYGARNVPDHQRDAMFTRITNAGMAESRPHDVSVIAQ